MAVTHDVQRVSLESGTEKMWHYTLTLAEALTDLGVIGKNARKLTWEAPCQVSRRVVIHCRFPLITNMSKAELV
jgi:hypothetical protein